MFPLFLLNAGLGLLLALNSGGLWPRPILASHPKPMPLKIQSGPVRAPELNGAHGWLNTDHPLSLAALRGKVVLLDFWTYGCINCMHVIPDLKRLEASYPNSLVVIGVHSAKFANEKDTENIRKIILRYGIEHPVVNDADFAIWQSYAVSAWPTQVIIDPAGYVVGVAEGEGNYSILDKRIRDTVEEFRSRGELNEQPLKFKLERTKTGDTPLSFPGKVLADQKSGQLFIADSDHNRIVITKLDGSAIDIIGSGARGRADGSYTAASFSHPQGMTLDGTVLYVADTENHLIRAVDLALKKVTTVAGTGEQAREAIAGPAREVSLNSPWDLFIWKRDLFIAMAGPHQIWKLNLDKGDISVFAGTGREARSDGPLLEASFAQPSGITGDGKNLYVSDAESNTIRRIALTGPDEGQVNTLAGGDLFDFGYKDAAGDEARFQHPLGLIWWAGKLLIADTYNHSIRQLDPATGSVKTLAGSGKSGQADGAAPSFYEPGGLSVAGGKLYIADTDNNAVRVVDLRSGRASTLTLHGVAPPATAEAPDDSNVSTDADLTTEPNLEQITVAGTRAHVSANGSLVVNVNLPEGYHLNPLAPQRFSATITKGAANISFQGGAPEFSLSAAKVQLPLIVPIQAASPGESEVRILFRLYYCREDNTGTCRIKTFLWTAPVTVSQGPKTPWQIKANGSAK